MSVACADQTASGRRTMPVAGADQRGSGGRPVWWPDCEGSTSHQCGALLWSVSRLDAVIILSNPPQKQFMTLDPSQANKCPSAAQRLFEAGGGRGPDEPPEGLSRRGPIAPEGRAASTGLCRYYRGSY